MRKVFLFFLVLLANAIFAQDTIPYRVVPTAATGTSTKLFGFSPMSKKVGRVNGLAFGFGHVENKSVASQTINGLNLEANPVPAAGALAVFLAIMHLPESLRGLKRDNNENGDPQEGIKNWECKPDLKINGLNISTGCFFIPTSMNGLNVSLGNKFKDFNGISLAPLGTLADRQNGISMGIYNGNNCLKGTAIGIINRSQELKGLHLGFINHAKTNRGLQIGVFNRSHSKGFQIGAWNVNNKRALPFFNW